MVGSAGFGIGDPGDSSGLFSKIGFGGGLGPSGLECFGGGRPAFADGGVPLGPGEGLHPRAGGPQAPLIGRPNQEDLGLFLKDEPSDREPTKDIRGLESCPGRSGH